MAMEAVVIPMTLPPHAVLLLAWVLAQLFGLLLVFWDGCAFACFEGGGLIFQHTEN